MKCKIIWVFLFSVFLLSGSAIAKTIEGVMVKKIIDGDSIVVSDGLKDIKVRLWGVDTPEYRQPYSNAAKKFTKKLIQHEIVDLEVKDLDKYGRIVAMIRMANGAYANELLIKTGYAWVHIYYCKEPICEKWKDHQKVARKRKLGLWREPNPVAPWIWKQKHKRKK